MPDITVFPHGDRWSVAERDAQSPTLEFSTREAAEMAARQMAGDGALEVLEHDPTGLGDEAAGEAATTDPETAQPADVPESPRMTQPGL
jgi:Uncharacterized protein conserved in bacteria (DUF2188)